MDKIAHSDECLNELCQQTQAAYRVCFAMFAFFIIVGVLSAVAVSFHYSYWILKLALMFGLIVTSYLIPNSFFDNVFVEFSRVVAGFFLLLQVVRQ